MIDQSLMRIIEIGDSTGSLSQLISPNPVNGRSSVVKTPLGCSRMRHTTATTTSDGSTGVKNNSLSTSRPRNFWKKTTAASSEIIQTGTVLPRTNCNVTPIDLMNSRSFSKS